MPHIELVKNNGKPYLRIAESRYIKEIGRQKKFILKNLGPLSKFDDGQPDFLKRFREKFKKGEINFDGLSYYNKTQAKYNFEFEFNKSNPTSYSINFKNLGYIFLDKIYNELGINQVLSLEKSRTQIKYDLNGLTKLLVMNRILDPDSKKGAFENKDSYLFPIAHTEDLNQIYRCLDILNKKSEAIQQKINTELKKSSIGRKSDLTYYDVTNYYFETMYGDEDIYEIDENGDIKKDEKGNPIIKKKRLRKKGVSKENRKEPIVQMGLFIDNQGIPVSYNLFPGNTQDKTTFKEMIKTSLNNKELGRIVAVADNGMNAQGNMYLLVEKGNGYIISKSVKKSWSKMNEWVLDEDGYTTITNSNGEVVFKYKSRIYDRTLESDEKDENGKKKKITVKEKEIIYWSKKHYEKEKHQNSKFLEYLESCKEHPDKLKDKQRKSQEFIKTVQVNKETGEILKTKELVILLEDKIQKYKETMGYYAIVTSEIEDDDREIINKYHGLSRIEDSFRVIKSDLDGRPIRVRTDEHINAHFLICFIALTIIRLIQYKILKIENKRVLNVDGWEQGLTAEKMKSVLQEYQCSIDKNGICLLTGVTDELLKIFRAFDIKYELDTPTITDLNKLIRKVKGAKL